jgi:hypothetical protein
VRRHPNKSMPLFLITSSFRKSKPSDPTAAEYNRIKLDIATIRAELIRVQEDFASSTEKSDQLSLELIDSVASVEGLQSVVVGLNEKIDAIKGIVKSGTSLEDVQRGVNEVGVGRMSVTRPNSNTDDVVLQLEQERARTRDLEAKLESMKNTENDKTGNLFTVSASDTETEDEDERPRKSGPPVPPRKVSKVGSKDGVLRKELDVALRRVEEHEAEDSLLRKDLEVALNLANENAVELQSAETRLHATNLELADATTELEKATDLVERTRKDTQMDLQDATSRVDVLTKRVEETGLVYTRLALLHHTLSREANPDVFDVGGFITCVENISSDKQEMFKKVQAFAGVSDDLEKQKVAVGRLTEMVERSGGEHRAELAKREGGLKEQVVKMERSIVEYKKEIGVLSKRLKADTAAFKAATESNENASHRLMVERDAYLTQKTELSESVEKTTDALSRSQKARDGHVKGMFLKV